jgi:AcrR family transcriptional regulator
VGRRSLAAERTDEILDAAEACMIEHGYPDTTISRIASIAGMSPGHLTHYLPTKHAIITAMIERLMRRIKASLLPLQAVPPERRLKLALDRAFRVGDRNLIRLFDEIIAISFTDKDVREAVAALYRDFRSWWEDVVTAAHPNAPARRRRDVARSLVWLTHGGRLSVTLDMDPEEMRATRRTAQLLVDSLAS